MKTKYTVKLEREDLKSFCLACFADLPSAIRYVSAKNGCNEDHWMKYQNGQVVIYDETEKPVRAGLILSPGMCVYEMMEMDEHCEATKYYGLYSSIDRLYEDVAKYADKDIYTATSHSFGEPSLSKEGILEVLAFNDGLADWIIESEDIHKNAEAYFSCLSPAPFRTLLRIIRRNVL